MADTRDRLITAIVNAFHDPGNERDYADRLIAAGFGDVTALAAAAKAVVDEYDASGDGFHHAIRRLRAALAATPRPAEIDVERLARALERWWSADPGSSLPGTGSWEAAGGWAADAAAIAAAYAADPELRPDGLAERGV